MSASLQLIAVHLSLATPFALNADWLDAQDATRSKDADGTFGPLDVAHVGVSPGPRSVEGLKSVGRLKGILQPVLDLYDEVATKPELTDIFSAVSAEGGSGAEVALRVQRSMLTSVMEFLFLRPDHGGMRFIEGNCVFLPSVFGPSLSPPQAVSVAPAASALPSPPSPAAPANPSTPPVNHNDGGASAAPLLETDGVGDSRHAETKNLVGSLMEDRRETKKPAPLEEGEESGPLFRVSVQSQWKMQFGHVLQLVPRLGLAKQFDPAVCIGMLQQVHESVAALDTLSNQNVVLFAEERAFTNKLLFVLEEAARLQEPMTGCIVLHQMLASSSDTSRGVDGESIREDFKEARTQAEFGMHTGISPMALAPTFQAMGGGKGP
ncbi:unnamed protein product [Pylaiella littoralis]